MNLYVTRAVALALLSLSGSLARAGQIDPELQAQLKSLEPDQKVDIIVTLDTQADVNSITDSDRHLRRARLVDRLQRHSKRQQKSLLRFLTHRAERVQPLWIINGAAASVAAAWIPKLAKLPGVARIHPNATLGLPAPVGDSAAPPQWNLTAVHATDLWNLGHVGQGIVLANMDTGVDLAHPDLAGSYRGGSNSWYDPHSQHATPTDYSGAVSGHGTQTMGLMVGGDAGGSFVGVAPGARWIAVKVFNDAGTAQESDFHMGFQWLLDPDGNPLTDDAPDVVNASFQTASAGQCDTRFNADIETLKTAGIAVAIAAGNGGTGGSSSPANNPAGFAVGAVNSLNNIASFSARGPSSCDGTVFPEIVAPGVSVRTTDLSLGGMALYATVSGTSYATPHVAGGLALLREAFPAASVTDLEAALTSTATDRGLAGPDNSYGNGVMNLLAAYNALAANTQSPTSTDDSYAATEDTLLAIAAPGVLGNDSDPQNDPLTAVLVSNVSHGSLTLNADGSFDYTPAADFNGVDSFTYRASDGSHQSGTATVSLNVAPVNDAPQARADTATVTRGTTVVIPVLTNDSDVDGDTLTPVIETNPSHGSVTVNPDGTVSYTHDGSAAATDSFSYRAFDGQVHSGAVTVSLTIDLPPTPVGGADEYGVDEDVTFSLPAPGVLANDTPASGLNATLVSPPAHAASFSLNADGSFSYQPAANYHGPDSLVYKACSAPTVCSSDTTVSITVNPVNDAPAINSTAVITATQDSPYSYTVTATDPETADSPPQTLSYSLVSFPAGMTINADTGLISWTPTNAEVGNRNVTVRVKDSSGAANDSADQSFVIAVANVNDAPTLAPIGSPQNATAGTPFSVTATGSDIDAGDTLTYSLDAAPAWLSINPATGVVSGTPGAGDAGSSTVTVRAADNGTPSLAATTSFTLQVNPPANTAPVAVADTTFLYLRNVQRSVSYAGPLGLGVLANDSDAENQGLSAQLVAGPGSGTLLLSGNGSFTYLRSATGNVTFSYRASDGQAINNLSNTATVTLRTDTAPVANSDNCVYDVSAQTVSQAQRCSVTSAKVVRVNAALNDTDANTTTNVPTDGVGKTVIPGTAVITAVGSGVDVMANPACGQPALGSAPGARGTAVNHCDGTFTVNIAAGNGGSSISYSYRISDDLGAQSSARQNTLTVQP